MLELLFAVRSHCPVITEWTDMQIVTDKLLAYT